MQGVTGKNIHPVQLQRPEHTVNAGYHFGLSLRTSLQAIASAGSDGPLSVATDHYRWTANDNGRWHFCQRPLHQYLDVPCHKGNSFHFGVRLWQFGQSPIPATKSHLRYPIAWQLLAKASHYLMISISNVHQSGLLIHLAINTLFNLMVRHRCLTIPSSHTAASRARDESRAYPQMSYFSAD